MAQAIRQACLKIFWALLGLFTPKAEPGWKKSKKRNDLDFA